MTCLLRCMKSPYLGHKTDLPGRARRGRNCPAVRTSETDRHPLQVLFGSTATFSLSSTVCSVVPAEIVCQDERDLPRPRTSVIGDERT